MKNLITKKTHRRYPASNWDYKAISTIINDNGTKRDIYYYTLKDQNEGVEIFTGSNYIVGSIHKSYSKRYDMDKIPPKYKSVVGELKKIHQTTTWGNDVYINEN